MRNNYRIEKDKIIIYLRNKDDEIYETYVSLTNLNKLLNFDVKWSLKWSPRTQTYYVQATQYLGSFDGKPKYKNHALHKFIKPTSQSKNVIHHKNHNTLDNTDENLEEISNRKNSVIRKGANKNGTTGVRNVSYIKKENKYIVQFQIEGKNTVFGKFDKLEDAKKCANKYRDKIYSKVN